MRPTRRRSRPSRSSTTASSTASSRGSTSTSGSSSSPRTPAPAARAGPVPRDLRQQPRRVLHGPRRRAQAPHRHRAGGPGRQRADAARAARADLDHHPRAQRAAGRALRRPDRPRAARARHRARALGRPRPRRAEAVCKRLFKDRIFPVLTPLAVDPAHPFPYISGLSLNLAVSSATPRRAPSTSPGSRCRRRFSRFVPLGNQRFVPLEDVIREHLKKLFPGMEVLERAHLPGHPQRGPRGRGGRRREPAEGAREGAAPPPVRCPGAARGRGVDRPEGPRPAGLRARRGPRRGRVTCPVPST
jgi:hypothetical protein